jgi:signal transduction histidine kinase
MRRRLIAAIAGVAAVAVVLFAVPLALLLGRTYRDEDLLRLQRDTVAATREIDLSQQPGDALELPRTSDRLAVYDVRGRRIAGRGPALADAGVRAALASARPTDGRAGGRLVVAVPLLRGERVTGAVRAARDEARSITDARRAWLLLAAVGAGVLALAVLAARLLGTRLAVPLERVAAAASRLGEGDFSVRTTRERIAEVDAVARALDATAARLDELVSRERAFTADASHQLRTPLAALRIELEALAMTDGGGPELTAALAQVDRLQSTIDTLLSVARDAQPRSASVDLGALLDDVQARWRGPLAAAARPLHVRVPGQSLTVLASPRVLNEILDVLLDNAHRHGAGEVSVTARAVAGYAAVEVADGGAGFAIDVDLAFERRRGSGAGHGIGLALARSLAHAEGGRLDVPNPGPRPVVRLLLRRPHGAATASFDELGTAPPLAPT